MNSPDTAHPGALAGIRVIDLTRVLGGPYCTQILGDHGAEVIKIEPPTGDETRTWGPPFRDGDASYFIGVNRNKQAVALDFTKPKARELLFRLLEDADVLVENFKAGTLERWGIGYEQTLRARFPKLIHARVSGFGSDGPLGGRVGYDAVIQGMAGLMSVNGERGGPPLRLGIPIVDLATGLNTALGILMALIERGKSGLGQFVEASLFDSGVALLHPHLANYLLNHKTPGRTGSAHPNIAPYDCYPTRTAPIFLAVGNDRQYAIFCRRLGVEPLIADPRFVTNRDRVANRDALTALLQPVLDELDGHAIAETLLAEGVPCGPVLDLPDVIAHPQTIHREMVITEGEYSGFGTPIKLSRTPGGLRSVPQKFGQATRAVLAKAGYSDAEIDQLVADGVAFTTRGEVS
jgi:crotonobetainyl-CoA:carnitine CoA-transferase CaiB-like acyl-CoA transferase